MGLCFCWRFRSLKSKHHGEENQPILTATVTGINNDVGWKRHSLANSLKSGEELRVTQIVKQKADEERRRREELRVAQIAKQKAEEERRRLEELRVAQIARQRAEEERRRLEELRVAQIARQRAEEEQLRLEEELSDQIDFCIRTASTFDSRNPLACKLSLAKIREDSEVMRIFNLLNNQFGENSKLTLKNFISDDDRFVITGNRKGKSVGVKYLTPFRGAASHRVFGYFECGYCRREWNSAGSWTDKWQICQSCESRCYPYEQHPLAIREQEETEGDVEKRPHDSQRCQKCIELGRLCLPRIYYDISA